VSTVDTTSLSLLLGLVVAGLVSGLLPFVNAEALLAIAVLGRQDWWLALAASVTLGQVVAKALIFVGSREGASRVRDRRPAPRPGHRAGGRALARLGASRIPRILATLERPLAGSALVGVSAVVGVPPLAATSVLAGAAGMRTTMFCSTCLVGRLIRFCLVAYPLSQLRQS
jgi:membrane protein YqaA with SNARE-associated domain